MTLHEFLDRTATINDRDIRPALALALKNEIPRSREGYARFYRRVMDHLEMRPTASCGRVDVVPAWHRHTRRVARWASRRRCAGECRSSGGRRRPLDARGRPTRRAWSHPCDRGSV